MKILVCGGRDFAKTCYHEELFIYSKLDQFLLGRLSPRDRVELVQGAAKGADTTAREWAEVNGWHVCNREGNKDPKNRGYPAKWKENGVPQAGPIRNQEMLDNEHPDYVIAFPGGSGTADMVRRAKAAMAEGIVRDVIVYSWRDFELWNEGLDKTVLF